MDQQQRRHLRQQSTPIKLESKSIPVHPATQEQQQQAGTFQDGAGLSPRMDQLRQYVQDDGTVGITNTGHNQQHYLQVAQQHCQARPGQQQGQAPPVQLSEQDFRLLQHRKLDAEIDSIIHHNHISSPLHNEHYVKIERSRSNPEASQSLDTSQMPQETGIPFRFHGLLGNVEPIHDPGLRRPSSTRSDIVCGDWNTSLQPNWTLQMQRPFTPPDQSSPGYFPATPVQTPYGTVNQAGSSRQALSHFDVSELNNLRTIRSFTSPSHTPLLASIEQFESGVNLGTLDPDATIRPSRRPNLSRGNSQPDLLEEGGVQLNMDVLPTPPQTAPLRSSRKFDVTVKHHGALECVPKLSVVPSGDGMTFDLIRDLQGSTGASPHLSSIPESPMSNCDLPVESMAFAVPTQRSLHEPSPVYLGRNSVDFGAWDLPVRPPQSPRATSMAELNLDATIEDTGITAEEVQSYISEPDSATGKWTCMFPGCGKLHGRRENVRSHVQTHLNDRQFKCIHCRKTFVRQHDLKRHAHIHTGVKPYPCRCGNSFARHDALTRHRQRGICDGGFAGVVKKVAKRGRPRKERPDDDARADKFARTKKRVGEKSYTPSVSGTSESSFQDSPPPMMFESGDMATIQLELMESPEIQAFAFPPSVFSHTPPVSPRSTGFTPSPSKVLPGEEIMTPSSLVLDDDQERAIDINGNDLALVDPLQDSPLGSQPCSPPELSHSSPQSSTRVVDLEFSSLFNSSEAGLSRNEADYDTFTAQLNDAADDNFDASWNPSSFLDFDKDSEALPMTGFTRGLDDDALFSENCNNSNDGYF